MARRPALRMHLLAILWPSFLMAGVLEMLIFALVDPTTLRWMGGETLALSPSAVYSLAFFAFWAVIAVAGLLTRLLEGNPDDINREGASGAFRH
jgi:TRAP-type mannitol/chloroaromatic compound transport system permease small subunit